MPAAPVRYQSADEDSGRWSGFPFRHGTSGAGREELSAGEQAGYRRRAAQLAPADLLSWLHRDVWQSRRHGD